MVRPSPRRLVARIAFLALFAILAWFLIRLDWPRLAPAAVLFVGVPVAFILDALIAFRVRLCMDAAGISYRGKLTRWHRRWQDLAAWTYETVYAGLTRHLGPPSPGFMVRCGRPLTSGDRAGRRSRASRGLDRGSSRPPGGRAGRPSGVPVSAPVTRLFATAVLLLVGSVAIPAQPPGKIPRVGVLRPGSPPPEDFGQREAFEAGLRELGWRPGTNILIEYRYAGGRDERLADLAAELVRLPVDVIVASAPQGVRAAQQATRSIPIVMSTLPDPLGQGFVASLARPGGNTTGLTLDSEEPAGKQLELLKDALPALTRVGVLRNPQSPGSDVAKRQIAAAARRLQLDVRDFPVSRPEDLPRAFAAMSRAGVGAVLVRRDVLVLEPNRARILALAAERRLPAMYNFRQFPESGGFMSYGADLNDIHRRSASFVDRILKGAKPADLPIEQPTKFELVINLRTARALGVTLPPALWLRADVLIE